MKPTRRPEKPDPAGTRDDAADAAKRTPIPPSLAPEAVPVDVDRSVAGEEDPNAGVDSPEPT